MRHPDLGDAEYNAPDDDAAAVHIKRGWYVVDEPAPDEPAAPASVAQPRGRGAQPATPPEG
jgi:hypothetical protein